MAKERPSEQIIDIGDIPMINISNFKIDSLVGKGGFGSVYRGIWEGIDVAIKQWHLETLPNNLLQEFIKEAKIMHKSRHPNIVQLFAICIKQGKDCLIMEYLPNGSLYQNLSDFEINMPWFPLRWNISLDIAKGLNYLHSQNIIHQDMKSMNILLDKDWKAKISDFGLATIKSTITTSMSTLNNKIGSIRWNAPELFKRGTKRSKETDVYSFGMTLWEISSRKIPFSEEPDDVMIISFIKDGEKETIPDDCPKEFSEIITKCWNSNPNERPSMSDVIINLGKIIDLLRQDQKRTIEDISRKESQKNSIDLLKKESLKIPGEEEYERAIYLFNSGNRKEAISLFLKSSDLNYPPSFLWIYYLLSEDKNEKQKWKLKAEANFTWYQSKAQDGKSDSLYNLGRCYHERIGTEVDLKKAVELYTKAAEIGLASAQNDLGYCYYNGEGVSKDIKKAAEYFRKAAEQGLASAQCSLGYCYQYGEGVPKDMKRAAEWYTKSAEQGLAIAQFSLGISYENGDGVPKDINKAKEWYNKAAKQGHAKAQNQLQKLS